MINFKKVASILASGVMLASTISFAAAANLYPKPFTDGAAIVYGGNAASTDMAGAIDIYDQLKTRVGTSTDATISGEAKAVETASQPLYLGDYMNLTKETFLAAQLPNILKDGKVTDDDGTELDYELKIDVLKSKIIYGDGPDNLDIPIIYADTNSDSHIYTLRVVFPTAVNVSLLTDEPITLFGKQYVFSGSASDLSSTLATRKAVLFEKSIPVVINDGESVTAEGHTMSAAIEDADTAAITIDGVTESKDEGWSGKIGTVDVYVKNVVGPNVAGTSRYVEIYLNSNKLTLDNANEVKVGSIDVDGTNVTFTTSGHKTTEIKIDVTPYDFDDTIKYLGMGDSFTDPVFGGVKFSLVSVSPELEGSSRDKIVIKGTGEKTAGIKFTNKAGKLYDMDILRESELGVNASYYIHNNSGPQHYDGIDTQGAESYNATELGVGANYDLIAWPTGSRNATNADGVATSHAGEVMINENDYFITCSNEYTQIWRLKNIKASDAEIKVEDQGGTSSTVTVTLNATTVGATGTLTLADGSTTELTLNTTNAVTSDKACHYLYTERGAKIRLDKASYAGGAGNLSMSSRIIIEEETSYNGGTFKDASTNTLGTEQNTTIQFRWETDRTGRDMNLVSSTPSGTLNTHYWTDDVGDYDDYYVTQYGSIIKLEGNTDNIVTMYYPEDAMSVGFYIGEITSEITPGSTGVAGGQITIIKDSEVSTVANKHLIVVGGSCVNTAAAKILDSDAPLCGADFSTATNVGAGGYIIKTVDAAKAGGTAGKIAMLVAGYHAADTTNAIKRAMVIDGVTTDVDSEEIFPVVA